MKKPQFLKQTTPQPVKIVLELAPDEIEHLRRIAADAKSTPRRMATAMLRMVIVEHMKNYDKPPN